MIGNWFGLRRPQTRLAPVLIVTVAVLSLAPPGWAITPTITEFSMGLNSGSVPNLGIAVGADRNVWFTDNNGASPAIGRITPSGAIKEFDLSAGANPVGIAAGPDANLWFADQGTTKAIVRINPNTQALHAFSSGLNMGSLPVFMARGPDGNLWFTDEGSTQAIGRISTAGAIHEFSTELNSGSEPAAITAGPDGNLWFADTGTPAAIGRITMAGAIHEFSPAGNNPYGIARGSDGNLWFSDSTCGAGAEIGRVTPAGQIHLFSSGLNMGSCPYFIAAGADGSLWFTDEGSVKPAIGRITPGGKISEFSMGLNPGSTPYGIVGGPDGNIWFTDDNNSPPAIGRITTPPVAVTGAASVLGAGGAKATGTVNAHAQPTSFRFEYGTTTSYGSISGPVKVGSGFKNVAASATLPGLRPNTTYHYRLRATNPTDTTRGGDATFKTLPLAKVPRLRVKPKTWHEGPPHAGTKITFSLNRAAAVRLRFFSVKPGRTTTGKCRKPSSKNATAKPCTRLILVGATLRTGYRGKNGIRFKGRISKTKRLAPGSYQLTVTAIDLTTPKRSSRGARFTIVGA